MESGVNWATMSVMKSEVNTAIDGSPRNAMWNSILEQVQSETLAHAQMFVGPLGRGGLHWALDIARHLHCSGDKANGPCGVCPACLQHAIGQHPDLHMTFPVFKPPGKDYSISEHMLGPMREQLALNENFDMQDWRAKLNTGNKQLFISVREAAEIVRKLSLTAHAGGWKVLIIWGAEALRIDAANKLLKILEEPPKKTVFLLVAATTDGLPATVISRVQRWNVPPYQEQQVARSLQVEGHEAAPVEDALRLCEGDMAVARRIAASPASAGFALYVEWMRACYGRAGQRITELAADFHDLGREDQKQFFDYALHMTRQCIVAGYGADSLVRLRAEELAFANKFARFIHHGNVSKMRDELEKAAAEIAGNVYGRTVFLDLSMKIQALLHIPQ